MSQFKNPKNLKDNYLGLRLHELKDNLFLMDELYKKLIDSDRESADKLKGHLEDIDSILEEYEDLLTQKNAI